ncbi:MAG: NAD(P)H-hydrate dehydratase [Planctomycetales bacterium]
MTIPIDVSPLTLPARPDAAHKGTFGKVLIVAGSRGMSGAASLAGLGALRGGAGLVQVAVPKGILPIVASIEPSYMTVPLPEDSQGRIGPGTIGLVVELACQCTAVAIGPGWGASPDLVELARTIYSTVAVPLVIDADGLNALAGSAPPWPTAPPDAVRVLTPHPGEFARLLGTDTRTVQADRELLATEFSRKNGVVVLLKGQGTVVTDGRQVSINATGNSGMATGGAGDVLTGLIAALLAQGLHGYAAARLGAHLHGLAGDLAASEFGRPGLIASDLPRFLGHAWRQMGSA